MHRSGSFATAALVLGLLTATSADGQQQQFKANIRMTGGALDGPATGTVYYNGSKMRLELTSSGEQMTIISDPADGSMVMLMPSEKMYMEMPPGMAPVQAPRTRSLDPANPCASGELTGCMAQGEETVNGYPTRKWQYQLDGETHTAWIATQFRFAVRLVDGTGTTVDYTNVAPGAQPAALFSPPADYQAMDMAAAMMGAMSGRGGAMPPGINPAMMGGRGGMPPGFDPAMMAGRGAPIGPGAGTDPRYAQWEAGDGWIADLVVTASGGANANVRGGTSTSTFTYRATASVPITYGTPGLAAPIVGGQGPSWQLVAGQGSAKALAQPYTWSAESQYNSEVNIPASCPNESQTRTVTVVRGATEGRATDHTAMPIAILQAVFQTSQDLRTYRIMIGSGGELTESSETQTTLSGCGAVPETTTQRATRQVQWSANVNAEGQPLPSSPQNITGTTRVPLRLQVGDFSGEVQATVQWTLRPIR